MTDPVPISMIDLGVHQFFGMQTKKEGSLPAKRNFTYTKGHSDQLFAVWKKHITEEVVPHPGRLFMCDPITPYWSEEKQLVDELINYAKARLGNRFAEYTISERGIGRIVDHNGNPFFRFDNFMQENGFSFNPSKIMTRGFGEYTSQCVPWELASLNVMIGMKNYVPYQNPHSFVLWKKSVPYRKEHFFPWEVAKLRKRDVLEIRERMQKFMRVRRRTAIKIRQHEELAARFNHYHATLPEKPKFRPLKGVKRKRP